MDVTMKTTVCKYEGKIYKTVKKTENNTVILSSYDEKINKRSVLYIAHLGVYHTEVNIEDVDELYDVENWVLYRGLLCNPRSLDKVLLKYNSIYIVAPKDINATEYGFEREDNSFYQKKVKLKDIEAVVTKKVWIKGKEKGTTEIIKTDMVQFLEEDLYYY